MARWPQLENERISLRVSDDGTSVVLADRKRGCEWALAPGFPGFVPSAGDGIQPLARGTAVERNDRITTAYPVAGCIVEYTWDLEQDHVRLSVDSASDGLAGLSLPGPFVPKVGVCEVAVPLYQGVLIRSRGTNWRRTVEHGGHCAFSMSMAATLGNRGALLLAHDSPANWRATYGEKDGRPFVFFEHRHCPVDGWDGASLRIYPCDSALTAICKLYRRIVQRRGDFVSWDDKIAAKPIVDNLFGALIAFTGYNRCDEIDYAANVRKLRSVGFDRVLYYPVRMCHYSLGFEMGGDDPVWLSDDEIHRVRTVDGARVAPWAWIYEGLDDGSESMRRIFRCDERGPVANWRMDSNQWYSVCTPYQIEHMRGRLAGDMEAVDWLHFDVNASIPARPCLSTEHSLHDGRPMGAREDMRFTRELFGAATVGDRVVSSEGFSDYFASIYDIGSTKILPSDGPNGCMPVPMTMLVYHDSCVHDWWELHNYNANPGFPLRDAADGIGRAGSGEPFLKAALDALYGCPPNLFPFGRQYGWVTTPGGETYSFQIALENAEVQAAIRAALPVARLHRRIGRSEMCAFEFFSDDRFAQAATFSDGTRIVANLSREAREIEGAGVLPPQSWMEVAG